MADCLRAVEWVLRPARMACLALGRPAGPAERVRSTAQHIIARWRVASGQPPPPTLDAHALKSEGGGGGEVEQLGLAPEIQHCGVGVGEQEWVLAGLAPVHSARLCCGLGMALISVAGGHAVTCQPGKIDPPLGSSSLDWMSTCRPCSTMGSRQVDKLAPCREMWPAGGIPPSTQQGEQGRHTFIL